MHAHLTNVIRATASAMACNGVKEYFASPFGSIDNITCYGVEQIPTERSSTQDASGR